MIFHGATVADLEENGGWIRSQTYRTSPVYFAYVGPTRRIYVGIETMEYFE